LPYKKYKEKFIALIPARKGSKSIKNKNLYKILGKPLIYYTISAAKKSKIFDQIFVSSDSKEILDYSANQNVSTIIRPRKYSNDFSSANDVVKHFINQNDELKKEDIIVYLQPTSPFRNYIDIKKSIKLFIKNSSKSLVSVKQAGVCIYKTLFINKKYLKPFFDEKKMTISRQKVPTSFEVNGAIYIFKVKNFLKKKRFPIENSIPFIMKGLKNLDIDEYKDLIFLKRNIKKL
jgi:CMP-N,N'-diacetyllegionaminic acid synthase